MMHEFRDLFSTNFFDMKDIDGDMGEMRILLKLYAKQIKQQPYKMTLRYKECVKEELDQMMDDGIIEQVEESEWIGMMVVQENNIDEIMICADLMKLNDVSLHDSFTTLFTDEVIEGSGGQKIYSFTYVFSGYH